MPRSGSLTLSPRGQDDGEVIDSEVSDSEVILHRTKTAASTSVAPAARDLTRILTRYRAPLNA